MHARERLMIVAAIAVLAAAHRADRPPGASAEAGPATGRPIDLRTGNLLVSPGFEGGYQMHGAPEISVAAGWTPWFDESRTRPEYKGEAYEQRRPDGSIASMSMRVFHGVAVQKLFTSSSVHDAGIFQQVAVEPGTELRLSAWVMSWSSDCDDPCVSPIEPCRPGSPNSHGTYHVAVGIDPSGRAPDRLGAPPPEGVVWSADEVFAPYRDWHRLEVQATAASNVVTVYLRGRPEWPVKHNDSYWDDAVLSRVGTPTPGPDGGGSAYLPMAVRGVAAPVPTRPAPASSATAAPTTGSPVPATESPGATASATAVAPTTPAGPTPPDGTPAGSSTVPAGTATATASAGTAGPTAESTSGPSPTPGGGPTATGEPSDDRCVALVDNGGFEDGAAGWTLGPDGVAAPGTVAEGSPDGGDSSLRVGVGAPQLDMGPSWSHASQAVLVPTGIVTADLRIDVRPLSAETSAGDWQMVALRDEEGLPISLAWWRPGAASPVWTSIRVPLDPGAVAGRVVRVAVEVYNDGDGAPSSLLVDRVRIAACRPLPGHPDAATTGISSVLGRIAAGAITAAAAPRAAGAGPARSMRGAASALAADRAGRGARRLDAPVPPGADVRIDYPIRSHPSQSGFHLPPTCGDLSFESLVVRNVGQVAVDTGDWRLADASGSEMVLPSVMLPPDGRIRIWSRAGTPSTDGMFTDLYWQREQAVWDDVADEAVLRDDAGTEVARRGYP